MVGHANEEGMAGQERVVAVAVPAATVQGRIVVETKR